MIQWLRQSPKIVPNQKILKNVSKKQRNSVLHLFKTKMKLFTFIESFLSFLFPFCSDTFYQHYMGTVRSVQTKNSTILKQFKLLTFICVYDSLRMFYLLFGDLTPAQRLIHYDLFFYLIKGDFNWMPAVIFISCLYFIYKMYFDCSETNNRLLWNIIEEADTSFFLYPKTKNRQYIDQVIEAKMKLTFNLMQTVLVTFGITNCLKQFVLN